MYVGLLQGSWLMFNILGLRALNNFRATTFNLLLNDPSITLYNPTIRIQTRVKKLDRVWGKMIEKKPRDILGMRIIYDTNLINDDFMAYSIQRALERVSSLQMKKDYIITPKENGYMSLHGLIKFNEHNIEVQIRSSEMHRHAILGNSSNYHNLKTLEIRQFKLCKEIQ